MRKLFILLKTEEWKDNVAAAYDGKCRIIAINYGLQACKVKMLGTGAFVTFLKVKYVSLMCPGLYRGWPPLNFYWCANYIPGN